MHVKSCFFKNLYAIINAPYPYPFSEPSSNFGPIGFDQLIIVCWGIQSSEYIFCSIQHYTKILVTSAKSTTNYCWIEINIFIAELFGNENDSKKNCSSLEFLF